MAPPHPPGAIPEGLPAGEPVRVPVEVQPVEEESDGSTDLAIIHRFHVGGHEIRLDRDEFLSLNEIWQSWGSPAGRDPQRYIRLERCKRYSAAAREALNHQGSGDYPEPWPLSGGTWAHWLVAQDYAMWVNPALQVKLQLEYKAFKEQRHPSQLAASAPLDPAVLQDPLQNTSAAVTLLVQHDGQRATEIATLSAGWTAWSSSRGSRRRSPTRPCRPTWRRSTSTSPATTCRPTPSGTSAWPGGGGWRCTAIATARCIIPGPWSYSSPPSTSPHRIPIPPIAGRPVPGPPPQLTRPGSARAVPIARVFRFTENTEEPDIDGVFPA